jgi:hypothetical protein
MFRKPLTWVVIGVLGVLGAFGIYWFAPWKLFTSTTVHDTLSTPAPSVVSSAPAVVVSSAPAGPVVVAQGVFVTHEHPTTGTARIVRTPDGAARLELVGLATSDGPDLRVWLTDRPVDTGWDGFNKGRYLELGRLKGNRGDQVYPIPAGTDVTVYRSVTIWCIRFSVSFGAAPLAA